MRVLSGELAYKKVRNMSQGLFLRVLTLLFYLGEWVLVNAAAGGIGMSAVQIAKSMKFPVSGQVLLPNGC